MTDAYEEGMVRRREILGDDYVDAVSARASEFTDAFQRHVTETAWGRVWTRPGLPARTRSMLTLALLAAAGHHDELAIHLRAAISIGVTPDEIAEVLLHTSVYAGAPAGNAAFTTATRVLRELGRPEAAPRTSGS